MGFLDNYHPTGRLTIDGVSMHTPAWRASNLTPLWRGIAVRGTDRIIPGIPGVLPYRRRLTVRTHSIPLFICGDHDRDGNLLIDPWVGLEENLDFLHDYVVDPPNAGDGTRAASIVKPSGVVVTADIHVLDLVLGDVLEGTDASTGATGVGQRATLEVSIPAGRFA